MCTKPRVIVPGVFYQVSSRGVFGEDIFPTTELKNFFLKELAITLKKYSFTCCSWSLQKDHYHLVVESSEIPISKFMQRLNSVYAKKFNSERGREGVVFFRRYASVITEETELKELIRYVHLNPVRCGDCTLEELDHYKWSGHRAVVQGIDDNLVDKVCLLNQFSGSDPLHQYRIYLSSGKPGCDDDESIRIVRSANREKTGFSEPELWVIGSLDFIRKVLEMDRCRRARPGTLLLIQHWKSFIMHCNTVLTVKRRNSFTKAGSTRSPPRASFLHILETTVMISMLLRSQSIWELPDQEFPEWFPDMRKFPSRSI